MKNNLKNLILGLVLSFSLVGCIIPKKEPPTIQWGVKGDKPTAVWIDYDWEIRAIE